MPWGFGVAAISSIQGALYLFVLSVNSLVTIHRGLADPPGELPVWATLTMAMTAVALALAGEYPPRMRCILEAPREQESRALPKGGSQ